MTSCAASMSQQGEDSGDLDNASGRRESPPDSRSQHGPEAGRVSAAASLDIEAASLLGKVTIYGDTPILSVQHLYLGSAHGLDD